jgi:hypothetical protein
MAQQRHHENPFQHSFRCFVIWVLALPLLFNFVTHNNVPEVEAVAMAEPST